MAQVHYALKPSSVSAELGRWSLNGRVDSCEWDGEFVVRADALGVTCLLSALAGETLAALRGGPLHIDEITARGPFTHLRLNVFPDGGVSRLRVWGTATPAGRRAATAERCTRHSIMAIRAAGMDTPIGSTCC